MHRKRTLSIQRLYRTARVFAVVLTIALLASLTSGSGGTSRAASARALLRDDVDLCSAMPQGPDWQSYGVQGDPTLGCIANNISPDTQVDSAEINKTESAEQAHAIVTSSRESSAASAPPGTQVRDAGGFGDAGYAFEFEGEKTPNLNTRHPSYLEFARNCYLVNVIVAEDSKRGDIPFPLSQAEGVASGIDAKIRDLPCPGSPVTPTATATQVGVSLPSPTASATPQSDFDFKVEHIEVVQAIQTFDNKIPLVAGKKSVVRVFITGTSKSGATPTYPIEASAFYWPEGGTEVALKADPFSTPLNVPVGRSYLPREEDKSAINFIIPPEMATAGTFSLRIVANPNHTPPESDYENNELTQPFEFVQRAGLRIGYVRIGYEPPSQSTFSWPEGPLPNYISPLKKIYPISEAGVQYYEMPWRLRTTRSAYTTGLGQDLNLYLRQFYDTLGGDKPDILIGWLSSQYSEGFEYGGLAESAVPGQLGRVAVVLDYNSTETSGAKLAHEVAHDLGLKHTATKSDPNPPCGISKNGDANYWPKQQYGDSARIIEPGFDTVRMRVVDPQDHYDIMSYCEEQRWITTFHYNKLFDQNIKPATEFSLSTTDKIEIRAWGWLRGGGGAPTFYLDRQSDTNKGGSPGSGIMGQGSVRTSFGLDLFDGLSRGPVDGRSQSVTFQSEGTGSYCFQFLDANGNALYQRCFDPVFEDQESLEPIDQAGVVLQVPNPGNFARVVLVNNEGGQSTEVASVQKGAQPPTVTITSPRSGDTWEGEHTITWTGDPDLHYNILYSADGKKTWYPLQVDTQDTSYTFSTDEILPGDQTYIRVLASDGFDTTSADVGPITVPQQPNSPEPPPPPVSGEQGNASGNSSVGVVSTGSFPSWIAALFRPPLVFALGGVAVLLIVLLAALMIGARSRQRRATAGAVPVYPPVAPPTIAPIPPAYLAPVPGPTPNPFGVAEQQYLQLRNELAIGQITPQQYEEMARQLVVHDAQGRPWTLGTADGLWYVYDGRGWLQANPYLQ